MPYHVEDNLRAWHQTKTVREWGNSTLCRCGMRTLLWRLNNGWSPERAISEELPEERAEAPTLKTLRKDRVGVFYSRFKGVTWNRRMGLWQAYAWLKSPPKKAQSRRKLLGHFRTQEEAAIARDFGLIEDIGEELAAPRLNFHSSLSLWRDKKGR